jgi:hypothetical protein
MFEKKPRRWLATPGLMTGSYPRLGGLWWKAGLFWLIVLAAGIAAGKYWEALQIRAIETDQPVTATIISIWTEPRKHGEAKMGRISFTRQQGGREISCTITVAIERLPTSLHFVGKEVDIVPRSNSCYDPIIPILLP